MYQVTTEPQFYMLIVLFFWLFSAFAVPPKKKIGSNFYVLGRSQCCSLSINSLCIISLICTYLLLQRFTQVSSINGECKGQEVSHNSNGRYDHFKNLGSTTYLLMFNKIDVNNSYFTKIRSIDNSTVVVHPRASTSMTTMTSLSPSTPQQCDLFIVHETSL